MTVGHSSGAGKSGGEGGGTRRVFAYSNICALSTCIWRPRGMPWNFRLRCGWFRGIPKSVVTHTTVGQKRGGQANGQLQRALPGMGARPRVRRQATAQTGRLGASISAKRDWNSSPSSQGTSRSPEEGVRDLEIAAACLHKTSALRSLQTLHPVTAGSQCRTTCIILMGSLPGIRSLEAHKNNHNGPTNGASNGLALEKTQY